MDLSCPSTLASRSSILRSKAVSWFSIAAAVFSPLIKCVSFEACEMGSGMVCVNGKGLAKRSRIRGWKIVQEEMAYLARSWNACDAAI